MQQPVAPPNHPQPAPMPSRPTPPPLSVLNPVPIGPLLPSAFQRHWPLRSIAAGPTALLVVLGVTLVGVFTIPLDRPGLGWLLTAVAAAGGLVLVGARDARTPKASIAWGAAVVALLGVGTIRAAGWLFILCVLAAAGCAALSVAGARTFTGLPVALWSQVAAVFRAIPWAKRGLSRVQLGNNGGTVLRLAVSAGLGMVLLVI